MYADWGGGGRCNSYLLQLCTQVAAVTVVYRQCGTRDPGDTGNSSCTFVAFVPPSPFLPTFLARMAIASTPSSRGVCHIPTMSRSHPYSMTTGPRAWTTGRAVVTSTYTFQLGRFVACGVWPVPGYQDLGCQVTTHCTLWRVAVGTHSLPPGHQRSNVCLGSAYASLTLPRRSPGSQRRAV